MLPKGSSTDCHRDLAAFKDTDGKAYVVSAHNQHAPNGNLKRHSHWNVTQLLANIGGKLSLGAYPNGVQTGNIGSGNINYTKSAEVELSQAKGVQLC
jgi:hypothetical protein